MPEKTPGVRHAISRSTGATTWTRKDGDEWNTTCRDHGAAVSATARRAAWKNGSTPANFCAKRKSIASGKLAKITATGDLSPPPSERPRRDRQASHEEARREEGLMGKFDDPETFKP